jgi:hypothetical protein
MSADFPTSIYTPRATENLPGISYDASKKQILFSEDFQNLGNEINAIETILGLSPQGASASVGARISALDVILNKANLDSGYLMKWDGSKFVNSNIFQGANGNEGIGTTSPAGKLNIYSATASAVLGRYDNGNDNRGLDIGTGANAAYIQGKANVLSTPIAWNLALNPNGGNVGIGTTDPIAPLNVIYPFAMTDTTPRPIFRLESNEAHASYPFDLAFYGLGGATASVRAMILQTGQYNQSYGGNLSLQPYGGNVGIATISPTAKADINSDILRLRTAKTPSSAGAAGNQGDICWDSGYLYVCISTNSWVRSALATW